MGTTATLCAGGVATTALGVATGGVSFALIGGAAVIGICIYGAVIWISGARKMEREECFEYNRKICSFLGKKARKGRDGLTSMTRMALIRMRKRKQG